MNERDTKAPTVALYFGRKGKVIDKAEVSQLRLESIAILPVVQRIEDFSESVPDELFEINGIATASLSSQLDEIVNLVLENLALLRRSRRLFISYKRSESAQVALQLRHELDLRGYDVFLDTHSVPKGDKFQEVLWQRLADSDVMILLDTPSFMASRWTREELAEAEAMNIGIVQLIWPGHTPSPYTDLCERMYLDLASFVNDNLTNEQAIEVAHTVEALRSRCLAARHQRLIREFCLVASSVGIKAEVQIDRHLTFKNAAGGDVAVIPAVGVPDAMLYHDISNKFIKNPGSQALLLYDQRGLRPTWQAFLDWLDDFLPVKAMSIHKAELALRKV
ncbi:MAG: toll/interleukin-1 receptor domain-containing protein [Geminicoccaceae bacterium]